MPDGTHAVLCFMWQRRMGVEPTRDRAERPPSRFEDGETHRGPYTSISMTTGRIVPLTLALVKREHFNHQSALPARSRGPGRVAERRGQRQRGASDLPPEGAGASRRESVLAQALCRAGLPI